MEERKAVNTNTENIQKLMTLYKMSLRRIERLEEVLHNITRNENFELPFSVQQRIFQKYYTKEIKDL